MTLAGEHVHQTRDDLVEQACNSSQVGARDGPELSIFLAVCLLRSQAFVVVMQAADFRKCDYLIPVRRMHDPWIRCVHR